MRVLVSRTRLSGTVPNAAPFLSQTETTRLLDQHFCSLGPQMVFTSHPPWQSRGYENGWILLTLVFFFLFSTRTLWTFPVLIHICSSERRKQGSEAKRLIQEAAQTPSPEGGLEVGAPHDNGVSAHCTKEQLWEEKSC